MDIFNSREIAIALWALAVISYVFLSSKTIAFRISFRKILSAFFVRQIILPICLMIVYMAIVIYWLSEYGLWNAEQLKNTIFWCASIGVMSLFNMEKIKKDKNFFRHSVVDNLKLLAIIQFVLGVYTFPLWIEIVLVPILAFIGFMLPIAELDKKHPQVKTFLEYILSFFGVIFIGYTIYMLWTNFGEFGKEKTAYDFFVPPLLTLCYLPFVFFMLLYSTYEQVFIRIEFSTKVGIYRFLAKLYALLFFNVRINLLERWSDHLVRAGIESHSDLCETFRHVFRVRSAELNPKDVPEENGWSPYKAKDFLLSKELVTGFYNKLSDEEWYASSPMKEFGGDIISDNIAYYIDGSEEVANVLKLKVNVNDASRSQQARKKLEEMAEVLSIASLGEPLSEEMRVAISQGNSYAEKCGNKTISLVAESWPNHRSNGYDLRFRISRI